MMDNFALSGDISFVSLSNVPVEEYFNTSEKCTVKALLTLPNSGTVSTLFKDTLLLLLQRTSLEKLCTLRFMTFQVLLAWLTQYKMRDVNVIWPKLMLFSLLLHGLLSQHSGNLSFVRKLFGWMLHHIQTTKDFTCLLSHCPCQLESKLYGCGSSYQTSRDSASYRYSNRLSQPLFHNGYVIV